MTAGVSPGPRKRGPGADRQLRSFIPGAYMFFMAVVAQSFCYFPISVRGRRIVEPCIQPKHSAMLAAVIAAPHIFDEIDIHLTPTVATEPAIHIDTI